MESAVRFFQAPQQSFFLFVPRGTGKSTWLKQHYPDAEVIEFSDSVQPMMQQIRILRDHNYSLTNARDLLLPRLMNGEVAV